LLSSDDKHGVL